MMRPPLVLVPQYFGSLVFDRRTSRYAPFDHETTEALRITAEIGAAGLLGSAAGPRREILSDFVDHFQRAGWFTADGYFAGALLEAAPPARHLLGPLAVHVEIVASCNLSCTHCFAGELPRRADMTLAELDRLFAELAALGSFRVGLTGGEPLLRKDLLDVIDAATSHGLHPCITTNGLLLDERMARELGRRELVWLNVSLEGATAKTNDAVRGAGTFEEVIRRVRMLARHARFTLAFTILRDNADEVERCAELARDLGAHTAVFRPLYPVGTASAHPELAPTFAQYTNALARLSGVRAGDLRAIDPFSPQARAETQAKSHANLGCGAGNLVASVSASGRVSPCSFLGPAFEAASLRERSFAEIWNESPAFERMRRSTGAFAGGCRARALAEHGDVDAPDPWHDEWLALAGERLPPLTNVHATRRLPILREDMG